MGTNFTDLATSDPVTAGEINDRLEELGQAINTAIAASETDAVDVPITAGEDLAIRDVIYIETGLGGTAGRAYKADAGSAAKSSGAFVIGLVVAAISSGNTGTARVVGIMDGFTGLTAGAPQFVSETAGELTESEPTNSWLAGIAMSTTEVMVNTRGSQGAVST